MIPRRKLPAAPAPIQPAIKPAIKPADFDRFFNEFIESTKKKWGHDRTKTLGGSEVFGCIRKAYYSRHNTPKDADYAESWGATRRGDLIENYHVVPAMEHASKVEGFNIDYTGGDQQTLFCDGVPMSVTPDGLIHGLPRNWLEKYGIADLKSDCVMFEIKSIDPRVDLSEEKSIHRGQTQIQMGLVRENTKFRPHFAVILYVNASFFDDMSVFIIEWDENVYAVAKERAHLAYDAAGPGTLMREGKIDDSCKYCPYQSTCLSTTIAAMPPEKKQSKKDKTDPALVSDLDQLLEAAHALRAKKKKVTKEDETIKEQIKDVLRQHGERRAKDANWSVSYSMAAGKKTLDQALLSETLEAVMKVVKQFDLDGVIDDILKERGIGTEGQNEPRELNIDAFMKDGNPYEILRLTFTEPDAEDL